MAIASWSTFAEAEPEMAAAGRRLLHAGDGAIGFLASVGRDGRPHLAPVCPIFTDGRMYILVPARTPKRRDLEATGRFVLHAFLGAEDEEFSVGGRAALVSETDERAAVLGAVHFGSFDSTDPIFHLGIEVCRWSIWENPGQPTARVRVRRWRAG